MLRVCSSYNAAPQEMLHDRALLQHTQFKYTQAVRELEDKNRKLDDVQQENMKLKKQVQSGNKGVNEKLQQMNMDAHAGLMRLAQAQFKMFDSLDMMGGDMDDDIDDDMDSDNSASAGVGGAAPTSHKSSKRSMPEVTEPPTSRKLRSAKGDVVQDVVQPQPYTLENMKAAVEADVPAIFDIVGIPHMRELIMEKLKKNKTLYNTSTSGKATFKQIFEDLSGVRRIEEGLREPLWGYGLGTDIFHGLFPPTSAMGQAWSSLNYDSKIRPSEVMMVSGNSTKIVTPILDYGGVKTSQKDQCVPCHFDDIYNCTFGIFGVKTWLLAPPGAVEYGTGKEKNLNHAVDCSSSIFRKAVLNPGQLIYIPKNWWHEVHA